LQKTRDLTFVIVFAALSFITWGTLGQLPGTLTGIKGIAYAFLIIHAIPQAVAMLFFEGRRWRFFLMHTLFLLLSLPTNMGGAPFDVIMRSPLILVGLIVDVVVNSFYNLARTQGKIKLWLTLGTAFRWAIDPFVYIFIVNFYIATDVIPIYLPIFLLLTPLILAEGAATGYFAYKIYFRLKKIPSKKGELRDFRV